MDYPIPAGFEDIVIQREIRHQLMIQAKNDAHNEDVDWSRWQPTEEDLDLIKKMISRPVFKDSGNFHAGEHVMSAESKRRMMKGEEPEKEDRRWMTKTEANYKIGLQHFAIMFQEKNQKILKLADFLEFGTTSLIHPWDITEDVEEYETDPHTKKFIFQAY